MRILSSSALQAAPFPLGTLSLLLYHLFLVKDFFLGIAEGTRTPMYPLAFSWFLLEGKLLTFTMSNCQRCDKPFIPNHKKQLFCGVVCRAAFCSKRWADANKKTCIHCGAPCKHSSEMCKKCQTGYTVSRLKTVGDCKDSSEIRNFNRSWNKGIVSLPCQVCGYSLYTELAHIKPIHSFPKEALLIEVNDPSNILVLCKNHHWEQEHGFLPLDKIPKR